MELGPEGIGVWPHFDRDGDKISDLMEAVNVAYRDWNAFDPTVANLNVISFSQIQVGDTGSLVGGVVLPEEGIGYRHFYGLDPYPNSDNWGTLRMLQIIEAVGREWNLINKEGPRISIGDISFQNGGQMCWGPGGGPPCHDWHQMGRDADLRYMRDDGSEANYTFPDPHYSQSLTDELVKLFCKYGVTEVLADLDPNYPEENRSGLVSSPGCTITPTTGHANHFHIKIR
jgi:hypothetical protein